MAWLFKNKKKEKSKIEKIKEIFKERLPKFGFETHKKLSYIFLGTAIGGVAFLTSVLLNKKKKKDKYGVDVIFDEDVKKLSLFCRLKDYLKKKIKKKKKVW